MDDLPFQSADAAHFSHQFLEDLATGYWYSESLFAALELRLFDRIHLNRPTSGELAELIGCDPADLETLLQVLERLQLIAKIDGRWSNGQLATLYLLPGASSYMGDFLLYRKHMRPGWQALTDRLKGGNIQETQSWTAEDMARRTHEYLRATDQLLRQKASEIAALLNPACWQGPVLDVGGGAGSLCRVLLQTKISDAAVPENPPPEADLVELDEVLQAAGKIYPEEEDWQCITPVAADFRTYTTVKKYGLILLSNFLHAYGAGEAEELVCKAAAMLRKGGVLLIHDYFPERHGASPAKGPLYDLAMLLNTYNGRCHTGVEMQNWLNRGNLGKIFLRDLATDSSVLVAVRGTPLTEDIFLPKRNPELLDWPTLARAAGFERAVLLPAAEVITAPWVRQKCEYGCARYGGNLQCPPHGMDHRRTRELLDSFSSALVVEGAPPGREFHRKLLDLEKKAFLSGLPKAFVLGAGHCPLCDTCPEDGVCRFPDKARPSMEGSGIDVYETAKRAGIPLAPVREKMQFVKYLGLLLLE